MKRYSELSVEYKNAIVEEIRKSNPTCNELCKKYDISFYIYKKVMKEYNIKKIVKRKQRNMIDHNFFNVINTEEKAYWLGFLYADGCIYKKGEYYTVILVLSIIDKDHMYKFKKSLDTTYNVKEYANNSGPYCRIECSSKQLFSDLSKLGCIERKTLTLDFPTNEQVPEHLIHHFMRGYFDGDGTINSHKEIGNKRNQVRFQVLGTEKFIRGYLNKLPVSSEVKENITLQNTKSVKTIQICGNIQSKAIFDFLYKDATFYLDRKYAKYIKYFNK